MLVAKEPQKVRVQTPPPNSLNLLGKLKKRSVCGLFLAVIPHG